jgi:putative CocE/NonD family hydrolase
MSRSTTSPLHKVFVALAFAVAVPAALPRASQLPAQAERYAVRDVMIPTRDGTKLFTRIYAPKDQREPLPLIMLRTPYGNDGALGRLNVYMRALADDGYIFVFQDIRGKFKSEGTFVMQRPARTAGDPKSADDRTNIDEGTDTYDTIDWLVKNVPQNNGRVGMLGISYDGWTTIMGALEPHPALKAISPQASPADMWLGDDFHHNGAFRLSYGFEYASMMESGKDVQQFQFDRYDLFGWYLDLGPLANINERYLKGKIPTWNDYVAHPDYDEFWKRQTMIPFIRDAKVPTLNVAGWWDQEDFYGPIRIYDALEKLDKNKLNYLVVGPWNHGGWSRGTGEALGPIQFGSATSTYFREQVQAPWFAFFLKDKGKLDLPEALTFEAGSNKWQRWDSWPPKMSVTTKPLYFSKDRALSWTMPVETGPAASDSYVSDPAHPVPYRQRPIQQTYGPGSKWSTWLTEDQRFVEDRADVLSWKTPVLTDDVTIAGEVVAHLFASTTGSDADWIAKLIDVYPEQPARPGDMAGYEFMVSNEVFRGRYRQGFDRSAAIAPGAVLEYTFSLHTQNYAFQKGHRIMVQVQSTWFPLIDRNPQTFVKNIFLAKSSDFRAATHKIYRSGRAASHVAIPVVSR